MGAVPRHLAQLPLNEVRCQTPTPFMDESPDRATHAPATFTRTEVLLALRLDGEAGWTHEIGNAV